MANHEAPAAEGPNDDDLQFETAEYSEPSPGPSCVACKKPVADTYYTLNDNVLCAGCRESFVAYRSQGSGFGRFLRAGVFGAAAAFVGFLIYFGVMKTTGYEVGLISILVGFMVGSAVRRGSSHRGGFVYQALAVFLAYTAIGASYAAHALPELIAGLKEKHAEEQKAAAPAVPGKEKPAANEQPPAGPAKPEAIAKTQPEAPKDAEPLGSKKSEEVAKTDVAKAADAAKPANAAQPGAPKAEKIPSAGAFAIALVFIFMAAVLFVYAIPILVGINSPISLLIVGFALWEAWKLNRRVPFEIQGPFETSPTAPSEPEAMPPDGAPSHVA